jgi:hypothetical protein
MEGLRPAGRCGRSFSVHPEGKDAPLLAGPPEKDECILVLGDAEAADCRDIERVANVRQSVRTREPPDGESRGGDGDAGSQDDDNPHKLAEPLA